VRTAAGSLAANVLVQLHDSSFNFYRSTNTDSSGQYSLPDVPVGSFTVDAFEPNTNVPTTVVVSVVQDQTTTQDLNPGRPGNRPGAGELRQRQRGAQ